MKKSINQFADHKSLAYANRPMICATKFAYRFRFLFLGLALGVYLGIFAVGCSTVRGIGYDLVGASEGMSEMTDKTKSKR